MSSVIRLNVIGLLVRRQDSPDSPRPALRSASSGRKCQVSQAAQRYIIGSSASLRKTQQEEHREKASSLLEK